MSGSEVRFSERFMCGADVATFRFERPAGYAFSPGQYLSLRVDTAEGPQAKPFSICSAPGDDYLEITTRLSGSAYKNGLLALEPGVLVHVSGAAGHLGVPEGATQVAFLVGGVGITPVRSILRDAVQRSRRFDDAFLMYGNRDETCVPFGDEFAEMGAIGVRTVVCYEHPPEGWTGESGFITAEMVRRYVDPAGDRRPFVVAGPPPMVAAMERVLDDLGIEDERRLVERFGV
jgi:glycine betaine catabolism B